MKNSTGITELQKVVESLSNQAQLSEGRAQRMERFMRWMMLGFAGIFLLVAGQNLSLIPTVWAEDPEQSAQMSSILPVDILKQMDKLLTNLNTMMEDPKTREQVSTLVTNINTLTGGLNSIMSDEELKHGLNTFFTDATILTSRLKQDSDMMRAFVLNDPDYQRLTPPQQQHYNRILTTMKTISDDPFGTTALSPNASPALALHQLRMSVDRSLNHMMQNMDIMTADMDGTAGRMSRMGHRMMPFFW
ncbi:MAG: hypothetical protein HQL54_09505 [Magnetococcales bacterium]|nr:hypothetical protein [Magnetococcales bacterium]